MSRYELNAVALVPEIRDRSRQLPIILVFFLLEKTQAVSSLYLVLCRILWILFQPNNKAIDSQLLDYSLGLICENFLFLCH